MQDKPKFFYITYPLPMEMAEEFPMPIRHDEKSSTEASVPLSGDGDFVPLWYGNARFPEDEE